MIAAHGAETSRPMNGNPAELELIEMKYFTLSLAVLAALAATVPANADININNRSGQCVIVCVPAGGGTTVCVPSC
jgi:hypothetical protein